MLLLLSLKLSLLGVDRNQFLQDRLLIVVSFFSRLNFKRIRNS